MGIAMYILVQIPMFFQNGLGVSAEKSGRGVEIILKQLIIQFIKELIYIKTAKLVKLNVNS